MQAGASAAVDRYFLPAGHSAAAAVDRRDRQTDGQTDVRPFHRTNSAYIGGSVAEWLACWAQAQKGPGSNRSRDTVE